MCYHVKTPGRPTLEELARRSCLELEFDIGTYRPQFHVSGFQYPDMAIRVGKELRLMQWGLIPFWVKDAEKAKQMQNRTLNAVGETMFEKPSYRSSVKNRGVVLVDGFYEWRAYKGKKYPYYITSDEPVQLGCIFSRWTDKETGEVKDTFSIVTTPANTMMAQIHNSKKRMPMVLSDPEAWMDPAATKEDIQNLVQPYTSDLQAWTISRKLNYFQREETNIPEITQPVEYPELPPL